MTVDDAILLSQPITLPCGITVPNRLVKAAMYEHLAGAGGGPPNEKHFRLYEHWAKGGWGMILTGNVQVSAEHLSLGADSVIPQLGSPSDLEPWKRYATAIHVSNSTAGRPLAVMQLSHGGRQSPRFVGGRWPWVRALAPSARRLGSDRKVGFLGDLVFKIGFDFPNPMTRADIDKAIKQFVHGATVAWKAGFDGVELHASHGYLISQFISRKTNLRTDEYAEPLHFLRQIVVAIREIVPRTFVVGVKLNSGDYVHGGFSEEHSLEHVKTISGWNMLDFIEVSGGDYEDPKFGQVTTRQAFFSSFSRKALEVARSSNSPPLIILTGSLRTRKVMASSIRNGHTQLIGIGRPSILQPSFASALRNPNLSEEDVRPPQEPNVPDLNISPLIGSGLATLWYCWAMGQIVKGREADVRVMPWFPLLQMSFGIDPFDGWKVLLVLSLALGLSYCYLFI